MMQQNNVSRLNAIIVKEITLGHKYRWHATTEIRLYLHC